MTRRVTELYKIVNPTKVATVSKAINKYKAAGKPGMCTMSLKLAEKYDKEWRHVNPDNILKHQSSPTKSSKAKQALGFSNAPAVTFSGAAAGAAQPSFGGAAFGSGDAPPMFGGGDAPPIFGSGATDGAAPAFGFGGAPPTTFGASAGASGAAPSVGFGFGTDATDTDPSFGGAAFGGAAFGGGGSDAAPSFGGAAFGGGGSDAPPAFGSSFAVASTGGAGEKTGATTSAFGAAPAWGSTGAVSFGSPSSR